jgi:hypothetical protein
MLARVGRLVKVAHRWEMSSCHAGALRETGFKKMARPGGILVQVAGLVGVVWASCDEPG